VPNLENAPVSRTDHVCRFIDGETFHQGTREQLQQNVFWHHHVESKCFYDFVEGIHIRTRIIKKYRPISPLEVILYHTVIPCCIFGTTYLKYGFSPAQYVQLYRLTVLSILKLALSLQNIQSTKSRLFPNFSSHISQNSLRPSKSSSLRSIIKVAWYGLNWSCFHCLYRLEQHLVEQTVEGSWWLLLQFLPTSLRKVQLMVGYYAANLWPFQFHQTYLYSVELYQSDSSTQYIPLSSRGMFWKRKEKRKRTGRRWWKITIAELFINDKKVTSKDV